MKRKEDFFDIIDELNWCAFQMSDGNFEAAREFVTERNRIREKENTKEKEF